MRGRDFGALEVFWKFPAIPSNETGFEYLIFSRKGKITFFIGLNSEISFRISQELFSAFSVLKKAKIMLKRGSKLFKSKSLLSV